MANSLDLDQTQHSAASDEGYALFAGACLSQYLGYIRYLSVAKHIAVRFNFVGLLSFIEQLPYNWTLNGNLH